jgi:DNA-binding transcriptional ArsR family regulator
MLNAPGGTRVHDSPAPTLLADTAAGARFFRVLSDPIRLAVLRLLLEQERSVGELVSLLGVSQSRVSNHLACLRWCHFVAAERRSRQVVYRIADPRLADVIAAADRLTDDMCEHLSSCTRIGPDWV